MYETIIGVCFAIVLGGEPLNPCWMTLERTRFTTIEDCKFYAERREAFIGAEIAKQHQIAPVVSVQCRRIEGQGS